MHEVRRRDLTATLLDPSRRPVTVYAGDECLKKFNKFLILLYKLIKYREDKEFP